MCLSIQVLKTNHAPYKAPMVHHTTTHSKFLYIKVYKHLIFNPSHLMHILHISSPNGACEHPILIAILCRIQKDQIHLLIPSGLCKISI